MRLRQRTTAAGTTRTTRGASGTPTTATAPPSAASEHEENTRRSSRRRGVNHEEQEIVLLEEMIRFQRTDELAIELTKESIRENINKLNNGQTLLHLACHVGNIPAIELLIDAGAQINKRSSDGHTPLDMAYNTNQQKASVYLLEKGAKFTNTCVSTDRYYAGDIWTSTKHTGRTLLHWAARFGSRAAINAVLLEDIPIDIQNDSGTTALHMACSFGQEDAIDVLVSRGASFQVSAYKGMKPLDKCKGGSDGPLAMKLRQKYFPLHTAITNDNVNAVITLLNEVVNPHILNEEGFSPFQVALLNSKKDICHAILFQTLDRVNYWTINAAQINRIREYITTPCGRTPLSFLGQSIAPLDLIAGQNNDQMIDWLISLVYQLPDSSRDPLITSSDLDRALIHAAQRHADRAMIKLAEFGGDIYQQLPPFLYTHSRDTLAHLSYNRNLSAQLIQDLKDAYARSPKFLNWIRRRDFAEFLRRGGYYTGPNACNNVSTTSSIVVPSSRVSVKDHVFSLDICVVRMMSFI